MKITTVSFGLTKNLGNYQSSRLDISAEIEEGQDWKEALRQLKVLVADQIGGVHNDLTSISDHDLNLQGEIKSLLESIESRQQELDLLKNSLQSLDREVQELQQIKEFVDNSIQFFGLSKNPLFGMLKTFNESKEGQQPEQNNLATEEVEDCDPIF